MTFGEKLKEARKSAGLSQEQFAEKMSVSRSAVAKWETDKGMPDVNNLKVMAQLLNVSVDYLLDDDENITFNELKEAIDLNDYEKTGKCRDKRDACCVAKHRNADAIYALISSRKMSKAEWIVDFITTHELPNKIDGKNL
jgi:Predicted transcriptional regulators